MLFMERIYGKYQYYKFCGSFGPYIYNKRPLAKPSGVSYNSFVSAKDLDVYEKGALTLYTLRYCIDDDPLFFDILKTFYLKYKKGFIETSDFINHVNIMTSQDYTWLFDQYLYGYKIPELHYYNDIEINDSVNKTTFYYQWMNTTDEFKLPVNIIADTETIVLYPGIEVKSIELRNIDTLYFDMNNGYIEKFESTTKPVI